MADPKEPEKIEKPEDSDDDTVDMEVEIIVISPVVKSDEPAPCPGGQFFPQVMK